jgi:DNA polymerase-3 subunit beta
MIHPLHIKAALLAAAKNDIRYYLNGVCVEFGFDHVLSIGTNGSLAAVFRHAVAVEDMPPALIGQQFIIPRDTCALIAKSKLDRLSVTVGPERWLQFDGAGVSIRCQAVDGKFPDWRRVIGAAYGETPAITAQFDPDLLATFSRVAEALGSSARPVLWTTAPEGALGDIAHRVSIQGLSDEFVGVVMPLRPPVGAERPADWHR